MKTNSNQRLVKSCTCFYQPINTKRVKLPFHLLKIIVFQLSFQLFNMPSGKHHNIVPLPSNRVHVFFLNPCNNFNQLLHFHPHIIPDSTLWTLFPKLLNLAGTMATDCAPQVWNL